jgi:Flp pilus assembly pilin Flp
MLLMQLVQLIRNREEGQALVEYALILSLVSIAAIAILGIVGTDVVTVLTDVANALVPGSGG